MQPVFSPVLAPNVPAEVLQWSQRGFAVLPTNFNKSPNVGLGGWKNASSDIETIERMNWSGRPLRFGIVLGPQKAWGKELYLVGLDLDGPKDRDFDDNELKDDPAGSAFLEFAAKHMDASILQRTPRGLRLLLLTDGAVPQAKSLEVRAAEADAMITEAKQARAEADTGLAAVEAIVEEMANDTIRETPEEIILENPAPILAAPKPVQKRLTKLVHRYLDLQIDWRKRSEWLGSMMAMVQAWLGRDDLPNTAKEDGEQIRREFDDGPDM